MDWMSWKPWTALALILIAVFAIYTFAATQSHDSDAPAAAVTPSPRVAGGAGLRTVAAPGGIVVHTEWLEAQSGSYKSSRSLFAYKEPPPAPPPPPPPFAEPVLGPSFSSR